MGARTRTRMFNGCLNAFDLILVFSHIFKIDTLKINILLQQVLINTSHRDGVINRYGLLK